jgi:hypothetical protein
LTIREDGVRIDPMRNLCFAIALILLSGCGGYDGPGEGEEDQGYYGVTVTDNVPFAQETIQDIIDRENNNPPPSRGDRAMPNHDR